MFSVDHQPHCQPYGDSHACPHCDSHDDPTNVSHADSHGISNTKPDETKESS
jgi:hypothetical protein